MKINGIDHFVLTVRNINASCEFYSQVLGMQVISFDIERKALQCGNQKINLHQLGKEFEPKSLNPTPGAGDICLITDIPLEEVISHVRSHNIEIIGGPVKRTGAIGSIESIYIRDLDGNLIEIANYLTK